MTITKQIEFLREAFGARSTISDSAYKRLIDILDRADDEALTAVYVADIKFASILARIRLIRRGLPA